MDFLKSANTLPFSQIYNAVSPVDRMSHLSLLITYGAKDHSCILSQVFCDNYELFSSDTITALIKWAIRDIKRIDPLANGIYVCPHTRNTSVQLDSGAPYYEINKLGLIPTDKYETGSNCRWYYWPFDAN